MLDRNIAPPVSPLSIPTLLPYQRMELENGIEVVYIHDSSQQVFKLDVVFEAGIYYQKQPLIASSAVNMLNEGTGKHTAEELADLFDYYGACIDFNCGFNKSEISLISLNKYAKETIPMLVEMLVESIVPEKELDIFLTNKKQEFLVSQENTAFLARKKFSELLFGKSHPYANIITEKDYENVTTSSVREFYKQYLNAWNCRLVISGNVEDEVLNLICSHFCHLQVPHSLPHVPNYDFQSELPQHVHVEKKNSVQSSIRIGKSGVPLTHPDYPGFLLLNVTLGGYFGSRLMTNIREDKGYTYGVSSFNVSIPRGSYWCIATEVNGEQVEMAVSEILKEIQLLRTELVAKEELNVVKRFLHGDLLREVDGVFSQADALKHKLNYGLDNQVYRDLVRQINEIQAEDLLRLAVQYLNPDEMFYIVAGK